MQAERQAEMQAERRLANDGYPYTYADFLEHYGDVAHSFWLAAPLALAEPTLEQPYRQHFFRAPQPGDQRASAGFAVPGRSAPQPERPPALHGQAQLEAPLAQPAVPIFPSLSLLEETLWLVRLHLWLEPSIDVYERIAEELEGMPEYIARRRWMEAASSYAMGVGPLSRLGSGTMRGWVCQVWIKGYWHAQIP